MLKSRQALSYGSRMFITKFTVFHCWIPFWDCWHSPASPHPVYLRPTLIIILLSTPRSSLHDLLLSFSLYATKPVHSIHDLIVLVIFGGIMTWRLKAGIVESDRKLVSKVKGINRARYRDNGLPCDYYTWLPWQHSTRHIGYCGTGSA
jgi:hypothetical protein